MTTSTEHYLLTISRHGEKMGDRELTLTRRDGVLVDIDWGEGLRLPTTCTWECHDSLSEMLVSALVEGGQTIGHYGVDDDGDYVWSRMEYQFKFEQKEREMLYVAKADADTPVTIMSTESGVRMVLLDDEFSALAARCSGEVEYAQTLMAITRDIRKNGAPEIGTLRTTREGIRYGLGGAELFSGPVCENCGDALDVDDGEEEYCSTHCELAAANAAECHGA